MYKYVMDRENHEMERFLYFHMMEKLHGEGLPDFVLFDGGADINPFLYGEKPNIETMFDEERDKHSIDIYQWAKRYKIPRIGICRGSQFLHVMNGGKLIQHVEGHCCVHNIELRTREKFPVRCGHHQMGKITDENRYCVIGWSNPSLTSHVLEPEIYQWGRLEFAVQYHPEWMQYDDVGALYFINKVKEIVQESKK